MILQIQSTQEYSEMFLIESSLTIMKASPVPETISVSANASKGFLTKATFATEVTI